LARLVAPSGKGAYISSEMVILPLSERSTARVLILSGIGVNKLFAPDFWQSEKGKNLFELLKFVDGSKFWKAQVAELHFDEQLGLTILPQVGDEKIEFGMADNYREKFDNLMIFYLKIVQHKGWQTYQKVNLRVDNQIICK